MAQDGSIRARSAGSPGPNRTRRVLVVGARGHLGGLVSEACEARADLDVHAASHRPNAPTIQLDLNEPGTFERMRGFDVVVNASDTSKAWPLDAARDCLAHGQIFLETSADPDVFRALCALEDEGPGTVVLGAGTFPGLSTSLLEAAPDGPDLEFRARWSILSAAGPGTVEVMVDALSRPALTAEVGVLVESPPLSPVTRRAVDGKVRAVLPLSVPDVVLAAHARPLTSARFLVAVRPALPRPVLRVVGALCARGIFLRGPLRALAGAGLGVLRGVLFRRASTDLRIELHATDGAVAAVTCPDAFRAGAAGIAALAALWPAGLSGPRLPYEGLPLRALADELAGLATFELGLEQRAGERGEPSSGRTPGGRFPAKQPDPDRAGA